VSTIFISHSRHDESRVRSFVNALTGHLKGHRLFVDDENLRPGDEWRMAIYLALAQCDAAILILTRSALTRPWVVKETTILSWRRSLSARGGAPLKIIPVLLEGVDAPAVAKAFPTAYLDENQYVEIADLGNDAAVAAAVDTVAGRFATIPECSDAMHRWIEDLGTWFTSVPSHFLNGVARAIAMDDDGWQTDLTREVLASAVLHATFEQIMAAIMRIVDSGAETMPQIVRCLRALAIGADAASALAKAVGDPPPAEVVAINSQHPRVARLFVERATCSQWAALVQPPAIATETPDAAYSSFVAALGEEVFWSQDDEPLDRAVDAFDQPITVLVPWGPGRHGFAKADARHVVERLLTEYPRVVVILGWSESTPSASDVEPHVLVHSEPRLAPGSEAEIVRQVRLIETRSGVGA
jgi:hypothetical protein